jgi:predicted DNA-binding transcriptional regulator YafY
MRKASRLFEIIQILRLANRPVTAQTIADRLEVTVRSIYRDIAALQAMRVPIEGGRGIGYLLRAGFDLPPLMFSIDETEAMVLALALLQRSGDTALRKAARRAEDKIAGALPAPLRQVLVGNALYAWGTTTPEPAGVDLSLVRQAIRDEQKLAIAYRDEQGRPSERTICPLALIYYSASTNLVAWCELRQAIRTFRADRIEASQALDMFFIGRGDALRAEWIAGWHANTSSS